ncbi:MAG: beta-N-acetylhexosaminidase, partial [Spirochaetota bacterium]
IVEDLNMESLLGQMLIIAVPSNKIDEKTIAIIKKYRPGGVILFGYNLDNGTCKSLADDLQELAMESIGVPLFISIDQEGGRVKRIQNGITQFPGNFALGVVNDPSKTYTMAQILGIQLRLSGINMNYAPVVDVNNNPDNPVINIRSFGCDPDLCASLGKAYIKGLQKSGCIAVAKHFPGHGDTYQDSHLTLPVIYKSLSQLEHIELVPFKQAIDAGVECIMTAHIAFPSMGINIPATTSSFFLSDILRKSLKFKGVIITDDLEMKGISGIQSYGNAAVNSIKAGADIVLISSYENHVQEIIDSLKGALHKGDISIELVKSKVTKILELKLRYNIAQINDGKLSLQIFEPSPDDLKLLQKADALNAELSQNSIVFYSKNSIHDFIIDNFNTYAEVTSKNDKLINIFKKENIIMNAPVNNKNNTIFLIDASCYSTIELRNMLKSMRYYGKVLLLITGNPYPYIKHFGNYPMLMSFSDTDESLHQLALCLKGVFEPKFSHPCLPVTTQ